MKVMISQPMAGKTDEEIAKTRECAIACLEDLGYDVIDTLFTDDWTHREKMKEDGVINIPVHFLSKSIDKMSLCDTVYFCKGWEKARGCRIEHLVATEYGLSIIYE